MDHRRGHGASDLRTPIIISTEFNRFMDVLIDDGCFFDKQPKWLDATQGFNKTPIDRIKTDRQLIQNRITHNMSALSDIPCWANALGIVTVTCCSRNTQRIFYGLISQGQQTEHFLRCKCHDAGRIIGRTCFPHACHRPSLWFTTQASWSEKKNLQTPNKAIE